MGSSKFKARAASTIAASGVKGRPEKAVSHPASGASLALNFERDRSRALALMVRGHELK